MDATIAKDRLHLRIEQANDQVLAVLAEVTEALFRTWQPEGIQRAPQLYQAAKAVSAKDLERIVGTSESQTDEGDYYTPEALQTETGSWLNENIA